jgi:hypothetical protein
LIYEAKGSRSNQHEGWLRAAAAAAAVRPHLNVTNLSAALKFLLIVTAGLSRNSFPSENMAGIIKCESNAALPSRHWYEATCRKYRQVAIIKNNNKDTSNIT